jgi:hypothetical protein
MQLSTEEAIKIYQTDRNYLNFYRNFLIESDNELAYYQVQNIHTYLHEVAGVRQQILKAFLVLNIGRYYKNPYKNPLIV